MIGVEKLGSLLKQLFHGVDAHQDLWQLHLGEKVFVELGNGTACRGVGTQVAEPVGILVQRRLWHDDTVLTPACRHNIVIGTT